MAENSNRPAQNLKVVRLMEPHLCVSCNFGGVADIKLADGTIERMTHCRRLDCDNWDYSSAEKAEFANPSQ